MDLQTVPAHHDDAQISAAYRFCATATRQASTNFYLAFRTLPFEMRMSAYAAYTFCRMCDDVVDSPLPNKNPEHQLNDMRKAVDNASEGIAEGPVWVALADSFRRFKLNPAHFIAVVDGCQMDVDINRYATFADLATYCRRVASSVGMICIELCEYDDPRAPKHADDLGIAFQLTNMLRDIGEDARSGRIYIPQEDMRRFNVHEDDLLREEPTPNFRRMMKFQIERARGYYISGAKVLPMLKQGSSCPELMLNFYSRILDNIDAADGDVLSRRIGIGNISKLMLVARFWLRQTTHIF